MGSIKGWIINIVTLVLFVTLVEVIMPEGRMRKFANLISGVIFIIAIMNPFLGFASGKFAVPELKLSGDTAAFKAEVDKNVESLRGQEKDEIIKIYRQNIINKIREFVNVPSARISVEFDETLGTDKFGELKKVQIWLGEKISTGNDIKNKLPNTIISEIAKTFGLLEKNITISTKEE